jgi:hypothetical protein
MYFSIPNQKSWQVQVENDILVESVNHTTMATTYHFSCKLHTTIVENCVQLILSGGWTSSINWVWC